MAGGEAVRIPLDADRAEIARLVQSCDALLLPGSKADVTPAKYGAAPHPSTADADPGRDTVDDLLLQHADQERKPILGICYGLQSLNVHRAGTLLQHIESSVNHAAGRQVAVAHKVEVEAGSRLAAILGSNPLNDSVPVNSSHHQSAEMVGKGLRAVAWCSDDGVIEAVEGTTQDHFVLAVQWHPERSVDRDEPSRAIFRALVQAARERQK